MERVKPDLERLNRAWRLTDDEEDGIFVPGGLWEPNSASHELSLVGRLLSTRPYHFEALCSSLQSMLLPVKWMEIEQLQEGRFLLRFKHILDKQRAMDGCPWNFEKNLLILKHVGDLENAMQDLETDESDCSWGATLRIRVRLNVSQPLKQALKIHSLMGEELLEGFRELGSDMPYGPWLRAPLSGRGRTQVYQSGGRNLGADNPQVEPNTCNIQIQPDRVVNQGGSVGEEVESTPHASSRVDLDRDVVTTGTEELRGSRLHPEGQQNLGPPWIVHTLTERIKLHQPGLVFISETKCKARRCDRLKNMVNYNGVGLDSVEQHEKQGTIARAPWQIRDFRECLVDCGLQDLGYVGDTFTWCNNRVAPHTVRARLDRVCSNMAWADLFPHVSITHEAMVCSDHFILWVGLEGETGQANEHRIRKEIKKIVNEEGKEVSDRRGIQDVFLQYFHSIFASSNPIIENIEEVLESVERRVTPAMNEALLQQFTSEEILHALKQMHPMKSPGPDEAFSGLIRRAKSTSAIQGIAVSRLAPPISHLLFPDDTLILCQASPKAMFCIRDILLLFEKASGLKINLTKSAMVCWSAKKLSQARRGILLKTVLQSIPTYASCFRLPNSLLKELESSMADFFWHIGEASKIHGKAWPKLCKPKKDGGIGFRRLKEYNLALLAKQAWRIALTSGNVLQAVISNKYFPCSTFMEARLGAYPSYTWRSIWASHDIVAAGIGFHGIEARDELVWHYKRNGAFSVKSAYRLAEELSEEGSCSQNGHSWNFIWRTKAPPKIALFAWMCVWDALPTTTNLKQRGANVTDGCINYPEEAEDSLHALFSCSFARLVWAVSGLP
ncbi:UNVERIFIED_CONTAM: hypothetical protein Slati_2109700 [Sesamum latifolium]|uniref:Reverse transcriptase zinc-binding domain-containing protein n=1 Tax=Sesamum latifolium TaxID=2727402 RepID=A0AAW2WR26_9LAMI